MTAIDATEVAQPGSDPPHPSPLDREVAQRRAIARNFVALSAARPLTWLSTIGLTILLPRYLGDVNLGKMNVAFAFADWCGLVASFGIGTYLAKEVAQRRDEASTIVLNATILRLVLAVVVGGLAAAVAHRLDYDPLTRNLVLLLTAHMLLMVFLGVLIGALQGVQQLRTVALVDASGKVVLVALVALVLLQGHGAVAVAGAYVVSDLVSVIWMLLAVRRLVGFSGPVSIRIGGGILRGGLPYLVWETALLTYARVDIIILSIFAEDAVLGWYGAAYRIIAIPLVVPSVLMTVMFPVFAAASDDEAVFNSMARKAVLMVALATVPMAFGLMALTGTIIDLFGYPIEFVNSITPTVILAATLPLVGINMIIGAMLCAKDRQRLWALAGVIAAALNVSLNFLAIPFAQDRWGNGAIGAAFVTSLTEVFLLAAGQYLMPRGILDRSTFVGSLKCFGIGAVMGGLVWLLRDLPVVLTVPLGAAVFGVGVLATETISSEDVRQARVLLSRRARATASPAPPL